LKDSNIFYFIAAAAALVISLGLTPLMIGLSRKLKILDMPNPRKSHTKPMPLMGGVAMYIATVVATLVYVLVISKLIPNQQPLDMGLVIAFMVGITGVAAMGLIDDIMRLSARRRLVILFILALIVLVGCLRFYFPVALMQSLPVVLLVSVIVVVWIVAITNAINFADGLDGLASALSLISALGFAVIFYLQGRTQLALPTTLALCGAIAGFLPYNINRAKVFMGDAGSMFIGFMLGILTIMSMSEEAIKEFIVPVYLMLVPIADMAMAVLRRLIMKKPIMQPDKMHFHHILMRRFKRQPLVVLILALVQAASAMVGVLIYRYDLHTLGWIVMGCLAVVAIIYTVHKAHRLIEAEKAQQAAVPASEK
jgi:UDP-GlcNAc:undecaprenyl-phosphate GlcNAc-1-phosphate transferase